MPIANRILFVDGFLYFAPFFSDIGCIAQIVWILSLIIKLYKLLLIVIFSIRNLHSFEKGIGEIFNDYGENMPSLSNISLRSFLFYGFYNLTYHFLNGHYPK